MARPTLLTTEVQDKIVAAIRDGNYAETAVLYAGISAKSLKGRTGLAQALEAVEGGQAGILMVSKLDRLDRFELNETRYRRKLPPD